MFRTIVVFVSLIIIAGAGSAVFAQDAPAPPPVADNASPIDNDIKLRSVELERIKREAEKAAVLRRDNGTELKFSLIKDDFEGIQKEHEKIINAYTKSKEINYKQITKSADKITEMAVRLRGNVFYADGDNKRDKNKADGENPYLGKSVRDLIVELHNNIGEVVLDPMWQKLKVVDPDVAKKVEASLVKVIKSSSALWIESRKMSSKK